MDKKIKFSEILFVVAFIAFVLLSLIVSSDKDDVDQEYDESYSEEYEEGFHDGYEEAREKYYDIGDVVCSAEWYAAKNNDSGWHPEEAWGTIEEYNNGENITKQEYDDAVSCLISFYKYFYSKNYEG